jgi:hypothetical protein
MPRKNSSGQQKSNAESERLFYRFGKKAFRFLLFFYMSDALVFATSDMPD